MTEKEKLIAQLLYTYRELLKHADSIALLYGGQYPTVAMLDPKAPHVVTFVAECEKQAARALAAKNST